MQVGFAWPQGITLDVLFTNTHSSLIKPIYEVGFATMGLYSEIPIRVGVLIQLSNYTQLSYGVNMAGVAAWPGIEIDGTDNPFAFSDYQLDFHPIDHTEFGVANGAWIALQYKRIGMRMELQRTAYFVPVGNERITQAYDQIYAGIYFSLLGSQ